MICSKCGIERDENEYQTYWHSRTSKIYRRKVCRVCISVQQKKNKQIYKERKKMAKIVSNEEIEVLEDSIWISKKPTRICSCCNKEQAINKFKVFKKGLSNKCDECKGINLPPKNSKYKDADGVYEFLYLIGWRYNLSSKIWFKPGIKEMDGTWLNLKPYISPKRVKVEKPKVISKTSNFRNNLNDAILMRKNGALIREIAAHYQISTTTVKAIFKKNNI